MSEGFQDDIHQGLKKIGAQYSTLEEKQQQMVQMIKRYEIKPQLECHINKDIQGLRKKRIPFGVKPSTHRWWYKYSGFERNGVLNVGISRNFTRLMFPCVPMFFFFYICQPIIHGNIYYKHFNNYQWDAMYFKFSMNRPLYSDQTITRLA